MMTFLKQNKLLVIIAVIFVGAVVYYGFLSGGRSSPALLSSDAQAPSADSQQLLVILANLKTIQLDPSVFTDPVYVSLTDFGVVISKEDVGRRNPFAPFTATGGTGAISIPGH